MAGERTDLFTMTMGELTSEAHRVGISFVAHMSTHELIEAIEQQREANAELQQDGVRETLRHETLRRDTVPEATPEAPTGRGDVLVPPQQRRSTTGTTPGTTSP
ncbi:hypothetical protein [Saccharomonospora iraqiensis]|uniref:hypothetical protein n=1 Tax=Saccharomonospora iraqiensis TaxID=52698 RepID=UPI000414FD13|nr:hypothetical protein [Saccharomonospora iraqiensis]